MTIINAYEPNNSFKIHEETVDRNKGEKWTILYSQLEILISLSN